ncbi:hypothetical protein SAMN05444004_102265 [Jannaschia faecimaris]|uniref:Ankyrin repeat-containing protein n=1 Tax=Jannaschia faecimaris TaxID=1244108 RepID=A0A1H3LQ46_9RHOB|nr:hypothetical protein [Jannaschia faecimaris]SDY66098.1 hypothetical protein SAMN05444004_102265 [Jannaschia faecimaris]
MIRLVAVALALVSLAACGGSASSGGETAAARTLSFGGGTCPDPDPVRDGPFVDAIRTGDARPVEAILAQRPDDPRALAAQAIITARPPPDPAQAACFSPYF